MIWNILTRRHTSFPEGTLDAYLDGELDERRMRAVEVHLKADPDAADYVSRGRRLRYDLHLLYDAHFREPLPPRQVELGIELGRRLHRRERRTWPKIVMFPVQVAAAAALVIAALAGLGAALPYLDGGGVTQDLFALFERGHAGTKPADQQLAAATGQEIGPDAAMMVSQAPDDGGTDSNSGGAPDFSSFGFNLIAARLISDTKEPAMQLVYEFRSRRARRTLLRTRQRDGQDEPRADG